MSEGGNGMEEKMKSVKCVDRVASLSKATVPNY